MSTPQSRLGEAEKQLRIVGEQLEDERKAVVAGQLADLVGLFSEGVDDHFQSARGQAGGEVRPEDRS